MKRIELILLTLKWILIYVSGHTNSDGFDIQAECHALADLRIKDTNLLSAVVVPSSNDLPEYCRVLGYVRPAINFEIRLPISPADCVHR